MNTRKVPNNLLTLSNGKRCVLGRAVGKTVRTNLEDCGKAIRETRENGEKAMGSLQEDREKTAEGLLLEYTVQIARCNWQATSDCYSDSSRSDR